MWAHYADHHRGVVLEFDQNHAFFNRRLGRQDDFRHFRKVVYTQERPNVFLADSDAVDFFYFKSKEWEYEQEWRLIVPLADCAERIEQPLGYPICLFEIPPECIHFRQHEILRHAKPDFLTGLELDIWIPAMRLAFEFQGAQHSKPFDYLGGEKTLRATKQRDLRKIALCKQHNVRLIHFHEGEQITEHSVRARLRSHEI